MACSIQRQKQIVEAAASEYKRLAALRDQGYDSDLENDIYDIEEAMNNMRAIAYKKPENIVESEVTPIDEMFINELNSKYNGIWKKDTKNINNGYPILNWQ